MEDIDEFTDWLIHHIGFFSTIYQCMPPYNQENSEPLKNVNQNIPFATSFSLLKILNTMFFTLNLTFRPTVIRGGVFFSLSII